MTLNNKLSLIDTADVERGFSAQNMTCTSQRSRLARENQNMLLMEAPKEVKRLSEWDVMKVTDKWGGKERERMLFSRREEEQPQRVAGMTDKLGRGAKRNRIHVIK